MALLTVHATLCAAAAPGLVCAGATVKCVRAWGYAEAVAEAIFVRGTAHADLAAADALAWHVCRAEGSVGEVAALSEC
jgi:hypothetical protein